MMIADAVRQLLRSGRTLARAPLFVACSAGTLAVGVGLSAAVLAALDMLVFMPPTGVRSPSELVTVGVSNYVDYMELAAQTSTLRVAARTTQSMLLQRDGGRSIELQVECVSGAYFPIVGVPLAGHAFDDASGWSAPPTVVLSHSLWSHEFGAAPDIFGRSVTLAGKPFQIVGVAAQGFGGVDGNPIDAWIPI